ncbi:hypothetical protein [Tropicimonas sp. S265A]|uniref:hypothetical protein n=1 Tax=Tropicimonas sp. S265A TaxID=3415134 RepID=UPI003C7B1A9C
MAEKVGSEEEFIEILQNKGFKVLIPKDNGVRYTEDGRIAAITYYDSSKQYADYTEFVEAHARFQASLPETYLERPRVAQDRFFPVPLCGYGYSVRWHAEDGNVVSVEASDYELCL